MFPWVRLIRVGVSVLAESKVDLLATTRVCLRVWPNDLDFNVHVNNGRYLALAELVACIGSCVPACLELHAIGKRSPWWAMQSPSFVMISKSSRPLRFTHV